MASLGPNELKLGQQDSRSINSHQGDMAYCFMKVHKWYQSHKSHNAPVPYPTIHHFGTEMCILMFQWCIVGYGTGALWDLWDWSIWMSSLCLLLLLFTLNMLNYFNSLAPGKCGNNFKIVILNLFHELISWAFPVKLLLGECHRTPLMISQHWFR